ncbi:unnamed protein product [Ilex paraguariensis]|uniref:Uncharacterized protein n=1 Tax=Ilex paraguariensis TaxID=185542 RepID=A0ABC8V1H0_9AQUA
MRPSLLVSLLLLSIFFYDAQGIRLEKGIFAAGKHKIQKEGVVEGVNSCTDGHCSGLIRKLMAKTNSTSRTITTSKVGFLGKKNVLAFLPKEKIETPSFPLFPSHNSTLLQNGKNEGNRAGGLGGKEENLSVSSSPDSGHGESSPEHYPDSLDIAGMDYSLARRKAPIHN